MRSVVIVGCFAVASSHAVGEPNSEDAGRHWSSVEPELRPPLQRKDGWRELATGVPVSFGTELIVIGNDRGRFSQLRIDAYRGKVVVIRIRVYASSGKVFAIEVGRRLDSTQKAVVIELPGPMALDMVAITTERYTNGSYALYGWSGEIGIAAL